MNKKISLRKREALFADRKTIRPEGDFVNMANHMIAKAVKQRASDIHLEPYFCEQESKQWARVRFRIDGVLQTTGYLSQKDYAGVATRIKVLAKMNITEKRLPQDGKFFYGNLDVRVSSVPENHGEKLVLRLLTGLKTIKTIGGLGMMSGQIDMVNRMVHKGRGMILVCGPTGCGKSTTLYAMMKSLAGPEVNIISVEDPVEMNVPEMTQIQLHEGIGLNYDMVLKGILRQDPDVIMVGEIRNASVAREVVRFAMTGHQVFTTLHTIHARGSVKRLLEMDIPPYLIADVLEGVIAQRLVRRLCPYCKTAILSGECEKAIWKIPVGTKIYRAKGCSRCMQSGYHERIGVFEILEVDDELKKCLTSGRMDAYEWENQNFWPFSRSMRSLILQGMTTVEEGVRIFGLA